MSQGSGQKTGSNLVGRRRAHQLLFRLAIAGVFLKAGRLKVMSWQSTVALFRDEYKVPVFPPEVAAALGSTFEIGCSTLLVLGLASRLATLPLLGMISTIQFFLYPDAWSEHLVWASILVFLLTRGPGSISIDRLIGLERGESSPGARRARGHLLRQRGRSRELGRAYPGTATSPGPL